MYLVVMFDVDDSLSIVHSDWLNDGNRVRWPKSSTLQAYQRLLLDGGCLPEKVPAYDFHEIYHSDNLRDAIKFERNFLAESGMSASTDDTLLMTPFSQRYTFRRRYHCHRMTVPSRYLRRREFEESLRYNSPTPLVISYLLAIHHLVHQH
ncbi:hypothetical protein FGIG_04994 [Fasciola gigantica]|uniref:Uncharacterized protein n=1 Tax=Fasciola gigantica TaxID=46835 RepID=A0A504YK93_FASGI|nr:hypothetical protein FGIG_04994 [Fasciola gigantica]